MHRHCHAACTALISASSNEFNDKLPPSFKFLEFVQFVEFSAVKFYNIFALHKISFWLTAHRLSLCILLSTFAVYQCPFSTASPLVKVGIEREVPYTKLIVLSFIER